MEFETSCRRLANVDYLRNLGYDSGAITRGRHTRRLRLQMHEHANGFNLVQGKSLLLSETIHVHVTVVTRQQKNVVAPRHHLISWTVTNVSPEIFVSGYWIATKISTKTHCKCRLCNDTDIHRHLCHSYKAHGILISVRITP